MNKKRILLVDDEPNITWILRLNLEKTGKYEVKEENRSIRALSTAREFNPDLILMDISMPEKDGFEVAYEISTDENLQHTPIVFLTASEIKKDTAPHIDLIHKHPVISKPVELYKVIRCIEETLKEQ